MMEHGLSYATKEEFNARRQIFAEKDAFILEYKAILGGREAHQEDNVVILPETNEDSVDWRSKNAVNPIKDQARCGSCWAFSAVCALEGAHFLKTGELISMSEQQVVSCDKVSQGCNGGW